MLIIDDNFLTEDEVLKYSNFKHKWVISELTNLEETDYYSFPEFETESKFQFVNVKKLFDFKEQVLYDELVLLVQKFAKKNNIEVLEITRMKFNLMVNSKSIKNETNIPHVDWTSKFTRQISDDLEAKNYVLLCYINDSDGPTIIYNEKYPVKSFKDLSVKEKINPKAGRAIFFEGDQYHSSSFPTNYNKRIVLNINLIGKIKNE
jgi:hypothetical protein